MQVLIAILVLAVLAVAQSSKEGSRISIVEANPEKNLTDSAEDSADVCDLPSQLEEANDAVDHDDDIEDSFFDPLSPPDPSCEDGNADCYSPPESTIEIETKIDATCLKGVADPDDNDNDDDDDDDSEETSCQTDGRKTFVDKHWGSDPSILRIRDQLRRAGSGASSIDESNLEDREPLSKSMKENKRPPIFLMPGLASTRLVAWRFKKCIGTFSSDIKIQDNVWLNLQLILQMGTVNVECMKECMRLGRNQTDTDDLKTGCKLRPDEGLDAIASLAPGGIGSSLLVGGTNTVYAWLIQWLADNLGYDVGNIIGLPYDWRLTPNRMEGRDGFLTMTRKRIEAAVASNGQPGIMVAHSMGNLVFRYFLEWLRVEIRKETYREYVKRTEKKAKAAQQKHKQEPQPKSEDSAESSYSTGWLSGAAPSLDYIYQWLHAPPPHADMDGGKASGSDDDTATSRLWQLAALEGDERWIEWLETHIWTYVGLSAPMLGAVNPLRAVISGENMGLPITDEVAREMEITFGSTHTVNPVSTKTGFCDDWDASQTENWEGSDDEDTGRSVREEKEKRLACLDDIMNDIEMSSSIRDPWENFPTLKGLLLDRVDWNTHKPMIDINIEDCPPKNNTKSPCIQVKKMALSPQDAQKGKVFSIFNELWPEEGSPLVIKREQLEESFWNQQVPNILNHTWDRPFIKHVIMAYGVDFPTESGYVYVKRVADSKGGGSGGKKSEPKASETKDGLPTLKTIVWEDANGVLSLQHVDNTKGGIADVLIKKKPRRTAHGKPETNLAHSGDGSVPYLSLSWAHTWLLHAARAKRFSGSEDTQQDRKSALDHISISHRPKGDTEWVEGPPKKRIHAIDDARKLMEADTGTSHPHGTRYKPEMVRYHNIGTSRTTGNEYTTTVIEAIGVEHKETTRNYDILAAVFTDVLKYMYDDLNLIEDKQ